jgi:hypothetical protein
MLDHLRRNKMPPFNYVDPKDTEKWAGRNIQRILSMPPSYKGSQEAREYLKEIKDEIVKKNFFDLIKEKLSY